MYSSYDSRTISTIVLTLVSFTSYTSWIFGLLSVNPQLSKHSDSLQASFAISLSAQGVLVFIYIVYSSNDARTFWTSKISRFKSLKTDLSTSPTTDTSVNSATSSFTMSGIIPTDTDRAMSTTESDTRLNSTSLLHTRLKADKSSRGNVIIPTETNQAYHTVMIRQEKDRKYTVTQNEAYGQLSELTQNTVIT